MKHTTGVLASLAGLAAIATTGGGLLVTSLANAARVDTGYSMATAYKVSGDLVVGSTATLSVVLTNNGTASYLNDAKAWVVFPKQLKRVGAATPEGALCEGYRGHQGGLSKAVYNDYCQLTIRGPIAPGTSVTIPFAVRLETAGTFNSTAETATGEPDAAGYLPTITRVSTDVTVTDAAPTPNPTPTPTPTPTPVPIVTELADLQTNVRMSTRNAKVNDPLTFWFTVKNGGKGEASDVTLTSSFPANANLTLAEAGAPSICALGAGTITCTVPSIPSGQTRNMSVSLTSPVAGPVNISLAASAANGDSNPANNYIAGTINVA